MSIVYCLDRILLSLEYNSCFAYLFSGRSLNFKQYTSIVGSQKWKTNLQTFGCITTITTAQPIHELKRIKHTFVTKLCGLGVSTKSMNLETVDTVEIGMFLGLHPSLTNIDWRSGTLTDTLGFNSDVSIFQIYRQRLILFHKHHLYTASFLSGNCKQPTPELDSGLTI